jgi:hypothetical protein
MDFSPSWAHKSDSFLYQILVLTEASPDINEDEQLGLMAQLVLAKQATFVKPASVHERIRQLQDIDQDVC